MGDGGWGDVGVEGGGGSEWVWVGGGGIRGVEF